MYTKELRRTKENSYDITDRDIKIL